MKKRLLKCALAMAALLVLGFLSPHIYWRIVGTVRGEAFYAGRPTTYWRGYLKDEQERSSRLARIYFGVGGPVTLRDSWEEWRDNWIGGANSSDVLETNEEAIAVLEELLRDADHQIRQAAFYAIRKHGERAKEARPDLLDFLMTKPHLEWKDVELLVELRPIWGENVGHLFCAYLDGANKQSVANALKAIGVIGEGAADAIPRLIVMLDADEAAGATDALAGIGPKAIPALTELLTNDQVHRRLHATKALAKMHGAAAERAALLKLQTNDADERIRTAANDGIFQIALAERISRIVRD